MTWRQRPIPSPSRAAALCIYLQHAGPSTLLHQQRLVSHVGQRQRDAAPTSAKSPFSSLSPRSRDIKEAPAPDEPEGAAILEEDGMDENQIEEISREADEGLSQSLQQTGGQSSFW